MKIFKEFKSVTVIVDEAGQGSISNILVPVMTGVKQIILVGDTVQLPPLVTSPKVYLDFIHISYFILYFRRCQRVLEYP